MADDHDLAAARNVETAKLLQSFDKFLAHELLLRLETAIRSVLQGLIPLRELAPCRAHSPTATSAADLKFLWQLPQTHVGTSNRKAALEA
jgi:hypothetical protein